MKAINPEFKPAGVYQPEELNTLKAAFDAACARSKVPVDDAEARQRILKKLLELASAGERDFSAVGSEI